MKIIDQNKLLGKLIVLDDITQMRIVIFKRIKEKSNGEKIFIYKNPSELFPNEKNRKNNDLSEFKTFFKVREEIIAKKKKNGEIEEIELDNNSKKIKKYGEIAEMITEVDSIDPRFIVLWHYNENIVINLYFAGNLIFKGNYKDFTVFCPNVNFGSKFFWTWFLFPFQTMHNPKIVGLGKTRFKKYIGDYDGNQETFDQIWGKSKNTNNQRIQNNMKLIEGIA